jgi:hypothetical protein
MHRSAFVSLARAGLGVLLAAVARAAPAAAQANAPSEGWMAYATGVLSPAGLRDLGAGRATGGSVALLRGTGTALEYGLEALYEQSGPTTRHDVRSYCTRADTGCQTPCTPAVAGCIEERASFYEMSDKTQLLGVVRLHATAGAVRPYAETGLGVYLFEAHGVASSVSTGGEPDPYEFHYDDRRRTGGLALAMGLGVEVPVARRAALLAGLRLHGHLGDGPEVLHPTLSAGVRLQ